MSDEGLTRASVHLFCIFSTLLTLCFFSIITINDGVQAGTWPGQGSRSSDGQCFYNNGCLWKHHLKDQWGVKAGSSGWVLLVFWIQCLKRHRMMRQRCYASHLRVISDWIDCLHFVCMNLQCSTKHKSHPSMIQKCCAFSQFYTQWTHMFSLILTKDHPQSKGTYRVHIFCGTDFLFNLYIVYLWFYFLMFRLTLKLEAAAV